MECFICGAKGEKTRLFDAVVKDGVVKICESCSIKENIPLIRQPSDLKLKDSEKNQTVYERLSKMSGLDADSHRAKFADPEKKEKIRKKNEELKKVVNERKELSFPSLKQIKPESKKDLIENYHWAILNARRARKLTQNQLAEAIAEPEASVKLVERGILPDNYLPFIRKIQTYLGITLTTKNTDKRDLSFDPASTNSLTLADLQEIKEKVGEDNSNSFFPYWKKKLNFLQRKRDKRKKKKQSVSEDIEIIDVNEVDAQNKKTDIQEENIKRESNSPRFEKIEESPKGKSFESEAKEKENKQEKKISKASEKQDLSQDEIDKIIFGK